MKIKDLNPKLQELAIAKQVEQGNEPNLEVNLAECRRAGNFDWDETREGYTFWNMVDDGEEPDYLQPIISRGKVWKEKVSDFLKDFTEWKEFIKESGITLKEIEENTELKKMKEEFNELSNQLHKLLS